MEFADVAVRDVASVGIEQAHRSAFAPVRLGETCPAADLGAAVPADEPADPNALPDVVGLSVAQATRSLGSGAVTLHDATGAGRSVDAARNWQVCAQEPAAGAPRGGPVTLNVVTLAEDC